MKKILGLTYGGLQKKMVNLVIGILLITIGVFAVLAYFQSRMLTDVVEETRIEQEQAISGTSKDTMLKVMEGSLASSTSLQASVADNDFAEVMNNVTMLQSMAGGLWENRGMVEPVKVSLPDPSHDGTVSVMALGEEGVDLGESEYLGILGHLAIPMTSMVSSSDKISACYIGFRDGTFLVADSMSSNKLDESGRPIPFQVRERPWYTGAVEEDGISFTGIMTDAFSGNLCVTCSVPVMADGEMIGVAGADLILESMTEIVNASNSQSGFSFVINEDGNVILAPQDNYLFPAEISDKAKGLKESSNTDIAKLVTDALADVTDLRVITIEDKEYYLAGAPMRTVGWALISIVDKEVTEAPENLLLEEYDKINQDARGRFRAGTVRTLCNILVVIVLIGIAGFFATLQVSRRIVSPIEEMTKDINISSQTGRLFEMKDAYRTDDEIEVLAEAFDDLSKKTKRYIQDITRITREKERVSTELQMANRIQNSMIPNVFPPFPGRREFDIYASMDPAREVGGDFYDFFLIDEDHLCLVMADVSGKGVPAALFMMISKVILQNCAMLGKSAAEILVKTNDAICSSNQVEMFVTVWAGILEISTGKITASNAGHEYPAVMQNGTFSLLKDKHGFVIGGMDGVQYTEYEIQLQPGDKLFLYTDGIPEAADKNENMFGTQRMLDALNKDTSASPRQILENVREEVDDFVMGAEQFDDMTMLCLEYKGKPAR